MNSVYLWLFFFQFNFPLNIHKLIPCNKTAIWNVLVDVIVFQHWISCKLSTFLLVKKFYNTPMSININLLCMLCIIMESNRSNTAIILYVCFSCRVILSVAHGEHIWHCRGCFSSGFCRKRGELSFGIEGWKLIFKFFKRGNLWMDHNVWLPQDLIGNLKLKISKMQQET